VGRDCTLFAGAALRLNSSLVQGAGTGAQGWKNFQPKPDRVPGRGTWTGCAMPGIALLCGATWRSIFIPGLEIHG